MKVSLPQTPIADSPGLLQGENPKTSEPEDILLWINVYSELVRFEGNLLAEISAASPGTGADPPAAAETGGIDLPWLRRRRRLHKARLKFWERRARAMTALRVLRNSGKNPSSAGLGSDA